MNIHARLVALFLLSVSLLTWHPRAAAHSANQSYVYFRILQDGIHGTVQVTTDDLNEALGLGLERGMTEAQVAPYNERILAYLRRHLEVNSKLGDHAVAFTGDHFTMPIRDGHVLGYDFTLDDLPRIPDVINVRFDPIMAADETHRTFALIEYNWKAGVHANESGISLRFSPDDVGPKPIDLTKGSLWTGFWAMVVSGMYHIYIGLDHILFLVALLLPAVLYRRETRAALGAAGTVAVGGGGAAWVGSDWAPVARFRPAFVYVLKIVTCFTVAHTITLSLAALGLVELPGWLVESLIALSIALAAAHNLHPLFRNDGMLIAFVFGLFHGFGFASVLGEVGLQGEYITLSLLGFNIGVELAQVIIICLLFPVLFLLRRTRFYRYLLVGGSVLLILIALYWFIERLGYDIPGYRTLQAIFGLE